ncbi:hypothetical protein J2X46_004750 [Nocardioides sp. BE266]|uniref:DUF1707 SHOCT-like domain-containing protein n=1 Tax=Nocardioides sp. BE266 TaxID=2817725 RepID=UPI002855331F|nr:DUF1707 domain-containing protein [Nocardioides sp. BE266]MDR7255733.1 hypothetical protein [Nocardioides sp. BE266]
MSQQYVDPRANTLATDAERDAVVTLLNEAFADGRLTPDEHADRSTRALAARTYGDLDQVLTGLVLPALPTAVVSGMSTARKVVFWVVALFTAPFLLIGVALLLGGDDVGDHIGGIFFLVIFGPSLFALHRWAHPKPDGTRRSFLPGR